MLAELGTSLPRALRSTVVTGSISTGLRLIGTRHAARQLRWNNQPQLSALHRRYATRRDQEAAGTSESEVASRSWGDKMVMLGITLRGFSMIQRLAPMASMLRFAGTGPMLIGAVVTVYELGGWRLVVSIPSTVAAILAASQLADKKWEEDLRREVAQELKMGCPEVPAVVVEALLSAPAHHYETNRIRIEVQCHDDASNNIQWRITLYGTRQRATQPWSASMLQASKGATEERCLGADQPPPQTRFWDGHTPPVRWQLAWEKVGEEISHATVDQNVTTMKHCSRPADCSPAGHWRFNGAIL